MFSITFCCTNNTEHFVFDVVAVRCSSFVSETFRNWKYWKVWPMCAVLVVVTHNSLLLRVKFKFKAKKKSTNHVLGVTYNPEETCCIFTRFFLPPFLCTFFSFLLLDVVVYIIGFFYSVSICFMFVYNWGDTCGYIQSSSERVHYTKVGLGW